MSNTPEPEPKKNDNTPVWELVIEDMKERDQMGRDKYGTPLQANNGRDPLVDAYQELLYGAVYLKQAIVERDQKSTCFRCGDKFKTWNSVICEECDKEVFLLKEEVSNLKEKEDDK